MMYCYIYILVNFEKGKCYDFKYYKLKIVVFNDDK